MKKIPLPLLTILCFLSLVVYEFIFYKKDNDEYFILNGVIILISWLLSLSLCYYAENYNKASKIDKDFKIGLIIIYILVSSIIVMFLNIMNKTAFKDQIFFIIEIVASSVLGISILNIFLARIQKNQ